MEQDTHPTSSNPNDNPIDEDDDIFYIEDADEMIDALEDDQDMEEETDDASFVFKKHKFGSVFCGHLNQNGQFAVTGGEDDRACVWNTSNGEILLESINHKDSVIFVGFNFDESLVATGDMSGIIRVWDLNKQCLIWDYSMGDLIWMRWHPAANVLFAGSVDGEVYMWRIPIGDCKIFQGHGCRAETSVIMPDGKRIVIGYEDGTIKIIDLKTSNVLCSILPKVGHSSLITALDCNLDNNLILSAGTDGRTMLVTSQTGKIVSILQSLHQEENEPKDDNNNWVETVAFCKNLAFQIAVTGTVKGEIYIWDIAKQALRQKINQDSGTSKLLWKGNTSLFFSAGLDGDLICYDAKNGQCVKSFSGHEKSILDIHISKDESTILTTADDTTARIFDIKFLL